MLEGPNPGKPTLFTAPTATVKESEYVIDKVVKKLYLY